LFEQAAGALFREVQLDGGVCRAEGAEHLGDQADAQRGRRAEPDSPALQPGKLVQLAAHGLRVGEHAPGQRQQRLPRAGQSAPGSRPVEELRAEILLERRDLAAEGGLRQVQPGRGPGEVAEPGYFDERLQLLKIHIHSLEVSI
jgi:hypothetical protein